MPARPGERHHKARLTPQIVEEARRLYGSGDWTFFALAERYDYVVEARTLRSAVRGESWAHLPGAVPLTTE
jgi:hypothetical protein